MHCCSECCQRIVVVSDICMCALAGAVSMYMSASCYVAAFNWVGCTLQCACGTSFETQRAPSSRHAMPLYLVLVRYVLKSCLNPCLHGVFSENDLHFGYQSSAVAAGTQLDGLAALNL